MDKQQWMTLAYWVMICVVIIACLIVISYLKGNANQCLADPLKYYTEKIGENCTTFCNGLWTTP